MNEILLLEIECSHCHRPFYVCRSCYQGQSYCCDPCRTAAQKNGHREAQRKYRRTANGREAHRNAEIRRRMRRNNKKCKKAQEKAKTVDDEGTTTSCCRTKLHTILPKRKPQCHFCGAYGVVVTHFPRRGYGSRPRVMQKNGWQTGHAWL